MDMTQKRVIENLARCKDAYADWSEDHQVLKAMWQAVKDRDYWKAWRAAKNASIPVRDSLPEGVMDYLDELIHPGHMVTIPLELGDEVLTLELHFSQRLSTHDVKALLKTSTANLRNRLCKCLVV